MNEMDIDQAIKYLRGRLESLVEAKRVLAALNAEVSSESGARKSGKQISALTSRVDVDDAEQTETAEEYPWRGAILTFLSDGHERHISEIVGHVHEAGHALKQDTIVKWILRAVSDGAIKRAGRGIYVKGA